MSTFEIVKGRDGVTTVPLNSCLSFCPLFFLKNEIFLVVKIYSHSSVNSSSAPSSSRDKRCISASIYAHAYVYCNEACGTKMQRNWRIRVSELFHTLRTQDSNELHLICAVQLTELCKNLREIRKNGPVWKFCHSADILPFTQLVAISS